jgi:Aspartyl protease
MGQGARSIEDSLTRADFEEAAKRAAKGRRSASLGPSEALTRGRIALLTNRLDQAEYFLSAALSGGRFDKIAPLLAETFYRLDEFGPAATWFRLAGRKAMARKLESFDGAVPYDMGGTAGARLEFVQTDPLPLVRVTADHGVEGFFLVDTGGSELLLDTDFGDRAGVTTYGSEPGTFAGGRHAAYEHGKLDSIELGGLVVRNIPVHLMRLGHLAGLAGRRRISGVIGTVFLYHFVPTLDYLGGRMILRRWEHRSLLEENTAARVAVRIPFWMERDHFILAKGTVNGWPTLWFVDSGLAGGGITCPKSTLLKAGVSLLGHPVGVGQGGGGAVAVRRFVVDRVGLGSAQQQKVVGWYGPFPPFLERGFGYRVGGILSHGFLCHYSVTLDFPSMRLYLETRSTHPAPLARSTGGGRKLRRGRSPRGSGSNAGPIERVVGKQPTSSGPVK